jgi:hypothetical protein
MNTIEIKKSLEVNGYESTLDAVIEDSKKGKLSSCFGSSFDYKSFAESRIQEASIKKAREIFNYEFSGKYVIVCCGNDWERKNVILK